MPSQKALAIGAVADYRFLGIGLALVFDEAAVTATVDFHVSLASFNPFRCDARMRDR
jgi:hypothetical protein